MAAVVKEEEAPLPIDRGPDQAGGVAASVQRGSQLVEQPGEDGRVEGDMQEFTSEHAGQDTIVSEDMRFFSD